MHEIYRRMQRSALIDRCIVAVVRCSQSHERASSGCRKACAFDDGMNRRHEEYTHAPNPMVLVVLHRQIPEIAASIEMKNSRDSPANEPCESVGVGGCRPRGERGSEGKKAYRKLERQRPKRMYRRRQAEVLSINRGIQRRAQVYLHIWRCC